LEQEKDSTTHHTIIQNMGIANAKADLKTYQDGYPFARNINNRRKTKNVRFYRGEIKSRSSGSPSGDTIDVFHKPMDQGGWWGDYDLLEEHHGYVQWLFPIHEQGLNYYAQVLQRHEAETIREDPTLQQRVVRSYELMLDFYGMKLDDRQTGKVSRSANFRRRYENLNRYRHNYLRITRILKCLGEMGLERLKLPFLIHVGTEILVHGELRNAKDSLLRYWAPTLRNKKDRDALQARIDAAVAKEKEEKERRLRERERLLADAKTRVEKEPSNVVGSRVSVQWRIERRRYPYGYVLKYYDGAIASFDSESGKHHVVFDDGDKRDYDLSDDSVLFFFIPNDDDDENDASTKSSETTPRPAESANGGVVSSPVPKKKRFA